VSDGPATTPDESALTRRASPGILTPDHGYHYVFAFALWGPLIGLLLFPAVLSAIAWLQGAPDFNKPVVLAVAGLAMAFPIALAATYAVGLIPAIVAGLVCLSICRSRGRTTWMTAGSAGLLGWLVFAILLSLKNGEPIPTIPDSSGRLEFVIAGAVTSMIAALVLAPIALRRALRER
jgi:hypothetical protein